MLKIAQAKVKFEELSIVTACQLSRRSTNESGRPVTALSMVTRTPSPRSPLAYNNSCSIADPWTAARIRYDSCPDASNA